MKQEHTLQNTGQGGFTLLIAALVASIVLSLGAAIFSIAIKQVTLASVGQDSQYAFYTADTASQCALYWDVRYQYFASTTPSTVTPTCDGQNLDVSGTGTGLSYPYSETFQYSPNNYCADVTVTKTLSGSNNSVSTTVTADGYSTSCATIDTNPEALQRTVELHY